MVADLGVEQIWSDWVIGAYETTKIGHPSLLLRTWQPIISGESTCYRKKWLQVGVDAIGSAFGASTSYACELAGNLASRGALGRVLVTYIAPSVNDVVFRDFP
jgi:hypothetical protein